MFRQETHKRFVSSPAHSLILLFSDAGNACGHVSIEFLDTAMLNTNSHKASDIVYAFHKTIPVMVGYIPIGIVYGFFAVSSGLSIWATICCTLFINGGAAQFAMVPMIVAGAPITGIVFTALLINLRLVFYGLPLLELYSKSGVKGWYSVFGLTDETFSLVTGNPEPLSMNRIFWITALNHVWITLGTTLGAILGARLQTDLCGLDFILCSLFAMLATELWRFRKAYGPALLALLAFAVASCLSSSNTLAVALCIVVIVAGSWSKYVHSGEFQ